MKIQIILMKVMCMYKAPFALMETEAIHTYLHISNNGLSETNHLEPSSPSRIFKNFLKHMNLVSRFDNFISALVMTSSFNTSVRT